MATPIDPPPDAPTSDASTEDPKSQFSGTRRKSAWSDTAGDPVVQETRLAADVKQAVSNLESRTSAPSGHLSPTYSLSGSTVVQDTPPLPSRLPGDRPFPPPQARYYQPQPSQPQSYGLRSYAPQLYETRPYSAQPAVPQLSHPSLLPLSHSKAYVPEAWNTSRNCYNRPTRGPDADDAYRTLLSSNGGITALVERIRRLDPVGAFVYMRAILQTRDSMVLPHQRSLPNDSPNARTTGDKPTTERAISTLPYPYDVHDPIDRKYATHFKKPDEILPGAALSTQGPSTADSEARSSRVSQTDDSSPRQQCEDLSVAHVQGPDCPPSPQIRSSGASTIVEVRKNTRTTETPEHSPDPQIPTVPQAQSSEASQSAGSHQSQSPSLSLECFPGPESSTSQQAQSPKDSSAIEVNQEQRLMASPEACSDTESSTSPQIQPPRFPQANNSNQIQVSPASPSHCYGPDPAADYQTSQARISRQQHPSGSTTEPTPSLPPATSPPGRSCALSPASEPRTTIITPATIHGQPIVVDLLNHSQELQDGDSCRTTIVTGISDECHGEPNAEGLHDHHREPQDDDSKQNTNMTSPHTFGLHPNANIALKATSRWRVWTAPRGTIRRLEQSAASILSKCSAYQRNHALAPEPVESGYHNLECSEGDDQPSKKRARTDGAPTESSGSMNGQSDDRESHPDDRQKGRSQRGDGDSLKHPSVVVETNKIAVRAFACPLLKFLPAECGGRRFECCPCAGYSQFCYVMQHIERRHVSDKMREDDRKLLSFATISCQTFDALKRHVASIRTAELKWKAVFEYLNPGSQAPNAFIIETAHNDYEEGIKSLRSEHTTIQPALGAYHTDSPTSQSFQEPAQMSVNAGQVERSSREDSKTLHAPSTPHEPLQQTVDGLQMFQQYQEFQECKKFRQFQASQNSALSIEGSTSTMCSGSTTTGSAGPRTPSRLSPEKDYALKAPSDSRPPSCRISSPTELSTECSAWKGRQQASSGVKKPLTIQCQADVLPDPATWADMGGVNTMLGAIDEDLIELSDLNELIPGIVS